MNDFQIGPGCLATIHELVEDGGTILELGSGTGTALLAERYTVYSVEHDPAWLNRYPATYIHAEIIGNWYSVAVLRNQLPDDYDLLLVDGPPGHIGRRGLLNHLDLFDVSVPLVIDDVHRRDEYLLLVKLAMMIERQPQIYDDTSPKGDQDKRFGVIL